MTPKVLKGTTSSGYHYEIPVARLKSYDFVEIMAENEENPLVFPKLVSFLLGDDKNDFLDHLRQKDGYLSAETVTKEITEIFESQKTIKN